MLVELFDYNFRKIQRIRYLPTCNNRSYNLFYFNFLGEEAFFKIWIWRKLRGNLLKFVKKSIQKITDRWILQLFNIWRRKWYSKKLRRYLEFCKTKWLPGVYRNFYHQSSLWKHANNWLCWLTGVHLYNGAGFTIMFQEEYPRSDFSWHSSGNHEILPNTEPPYSIGCHDAVTKRCYYRRANGRYRRWSHYGGRARNWGEGSILSSGGIHSLCSTASYREKFILVAQLTSPEFASIISFILLAKLSYSFIIRV